MIGNVEEAQLIRDWFIDNGCDPYGDRNTPEGWKRLGAGSYRVAFLAPSGVVYKVQRRYDGGAWCQTNKGEHLTLRSYFLRKFPKGCRFPRYSYFELDGRGVIAMECFERFLGSYSSYEENSPWNHHTRLSEFLHDVSDLHGGNVAVDEQGNLVPTDVGGSGAAW